MPEIDLKAVELLERKRWCMRVFAYLGLLLSCTALLCGPLRSENGDIAGVVVDKETQSSLPGTNVIVRMDLLIVRRWLFSGSALIVYFDVMNVYGRHNIWDYLYRSDGTREQIYQFSLFPVGGFVLEF